MAEEKLARVFTPIGLDLGGNRPAEIAVSIMAELVALQHGKLGPCARPPTGVATPAGDGGASAAGAVQGGERSNEGAGR